MTEALVCTIVTKNYLAYARALAVSLATHNPAVELYVLLADRNDGELNPAEEPFHLIPLEALSDQGAVQRMCFYYTPFELCCALRGLLHEYIWTHTTAERWIFLDSDICVYGSLTPIFERLKLAAILLTPHADVSDGIESQIALEFSFLYGGLYNAGFLGLRRCQTTYRFIQWWKKRLEDYCFNALGNQDPRGLFVDQLWLNLVPLYFQGVEFLSDPGCNLGHWNLWYRPLSYGADNAVLAGGEPLRFIHYSGWDLQQPHRVSKHNPYYDHEEQPIWASLGYFYKDLLLAQGHEVWQNIPYSFAFFTTGELITPAMRWGYYEDWKAGNVTELSPFTTPDRFQSRSLPLSTAQELQIRLADVAKWADSLYQETQQLRGDLNNAQVDLNDTQEHLNLAHFQVADLKTTCEQLQLERDQMCSLIREMEQSRLWKLRKFWLQCRNQFQRFINLSI